MYRVALGGYQNARGYHRQPDMTAKKFITHPVAGEVYLTGDIVRVRDDYFSHLLDTMY